MGNCLSRFWKNVDKRGDDECWLWTGGKNDKGYGQIQCGLKRWFAHRYSWMLENGPIEDGKLTVMHKCDNPPCVNPKHLSLGTQADNMRDMAAKGRAGRGGQRGVKHHASKFTAEQILDIRLSPISHTEMARKYGVTPQCIHYVRNDGWKSVETERVEYQRGKLGSAGEKNPTAILNEQKVREIRSSTDANATLAVRYGVTSDCIKSVRKRITWRHIDA